MANMKPKPVWLDFRKAARKRKFLPNLSAIAVAGECIWTASDEMRTIECLVADGDEYRLHEQHALDELFPDLPGAEDGEEADIEALDFIDGRLWICGSHSLTRRSHAKQQTDRVDPDIHERPSRRLLATLPLSTCGEEIVGPGDRMTFAGEGNLRDALTASPYIAPFEALPSKENGIDIEGMAIFDGRLYVGMRGPVVDNIAVIAEVELGASLTSGVSGVQLHFVDLEGLGVRDLTRYKKSLLILAGPVSSADGPFELLRWKPKRTARIQKAEPFRPLPSGLDHPEAVCLMQRRGRDGFLVLYDTEDAGRISGTQYRADWFKL